MNARMLLAAALLAPLALATPAHAAGATDSKITQNPFLKAGIRLYNDLEFDAALEQLKRAETFKGNTVRDDVLVHIYEGIVEYENNNRDAAQTEFTTALALDPAAELPRNVSPKIVDLFESVRTKMQKEKPIITPEPSRNPQLSKTPQPQQQPAGGLTASNATATPRSKVVPWVLVGSTAVLAGVGTAFAIRAHGQGSDAQSAVFQDQADASLGSAKSSAAVAYTALGAAVATGAAAAVLFVLDHKAAAGSAGDAK